MDSLYVHPADHAPLRLEADTSLSDGVVAQGRLVGADGAVFPIVDGIPDLTWPPYLAAEDARARSFYDGRVEAYDRNLHLTFETFNEDERAVREGMADLLRLGPGDRVLEIAAGTGRDSEVLARRLGPEGLLVVQDISAAMLSAARAKLNGVSVPVEFSVANGCHLPFPDDSFDAFFSFGGIGEFSDPGRAFREAARVVRPGGRVVVGDESMPPWLRGTEFDRLLTTTNPQFACELPLRALPVEAREVHVRWVIGGVFFLVDFTVGRGLPPANFDFEIPGERGGTHRTRLYGGLEGVTPETKSLAQRARAASGRTMHAWLDEVVRLAALRELGEDGAETE